MPINKNKELITSTFFDIFFQIYIKSKNEMMETISGELFSDNPSQKDANNTSKITRVG